MNFFPSTPEVILAIFTTLLSLAVSLFLLKIQISNLKSVKSLKSERKILVAHDSDANGFARSKLINLREIQDAVDFLDRDAQRHLDEIDENIRALEYQKKKISIMTLVGVALMICSLGANAYMSFRIHESVDEVYLSDFIPVVLVYVLFWAYILYLASVVKSYEKDIAMTRKRHDYLSEEIKKAIVLFRKGIKS